MSIVIPTYVKDILTNITVPYGQVLFVRVDGSQGHNIDLSKDINVIGVWGVPETGLMTATPVRRFLKISRGILYETAQFCQLLLNGVPVAIRMLYGNHLCISSPLWNELVTYRHRFLTQKVVDYHIWIADTTLNQCNKMLNNNISISNQVLYRLTKLTYIINSISKGEEPPIWFEDASVVEALTKIRSGNLQEKEAVELCSMTLLDARKRKPYCLPASPDYDFLEDWLIRTRKIK
jgi:hypothetical protein